MHLHSSHSVDFNPRAPCGARPSRNASKIWKQVFQSTRPVRGATESNCAECTPNVFQSTRPVRGATRNSSNACNSSPISIHAPRAGRDAATSAMPRMCVYFNPRAPCGARPPWTRAATIPSSFQSTRPARGATNRIKTSGHKITFQSTRPVRGATVRDMHIQDFDLFQSTRPVRGATAKVYKITLHTFATKGNS